MEPAVNPTNEVIVPCIDLGSVRFVQSNVKPLRRMNNADYPLKITCMHVHTNIHKNTYKYTDIIVPCS